MARAKGWATVPSTIALEKATNPFLRCSESGVIASARGKMPEAAVAPDSLAVFTALRAWKNSF